MKMSQKPLNVGLVGGGGGAFIVNPHQKAISYSQASIRTLILYFFKNALAFFLFFLSKASVSSGVK